MLILGDRFDFPDHPMPQIDRHRRGENDRLSEKCKYSWWFECWHVTGRGKEKIRCGKLHRVSCDGGTHIALELAEAALREAGWTLAPVAEGGGWRCPQHRTT